MNTLSFAFSPPPPRGRRVCCCTLVHRRMLLNAARSAASPLSLSLSPSSPSGSGIFILYCAPISFRMTERERERERENRESHLLYLCPLSEEGALDHRVNKCDFEGTVVASAHVHLSPSMMRLFGSFPPFPVFTSSCFSPASLT